MRVARTGAAFAVPHSVSFWRRSQDIPLEVLELSWTAPSGQVTGLLTCGPWDIFCKPLKPPLRAARNFLKYFCHRPRYPLRRNPSTDSGPSPPAETLRARSSVLPPSSPAGTPGVATNSPPLSDFGIDIGQVSTSGPQLTASNSWGGEGNRSTGGIAGGGVSSGFGDPNGVEGAIVVHSGRSGRCYTPGPFADYSSLERCGVANLVDHVAKRTLLVRCGTLNAALTAIRIVKLAPPICLPRGEVQY